jgi:cell division protein FtsI/penicillin-binding protein 2
MVARTNILIILFFLSFGVLTYNLYNIQIEKHDYYFQKVFARETNIQKSEVRRGEISITDKYKNKIPVAINKEYPIIYAVPAELKEPEKVAEMLSPILKISTSSLFSSLNNPKSLFRMLVEKPSDDIINAISQLNLKGIYQDTKFYREYPYRTLAAQTIGFVGLNENIIYPEGLYGVERYYEKELANQKHIQLTIDRNIEVKSEEILENLIKEQEAESGVVIVQNPKTGAILALANYTTFDLNEYSKSDVKIFSNSALEAVYEPGSVFKPITMAIGIDNGILTPTTTYNDKGFVILNGHKITNWDHKAYGPQTSMTKVIERSINTGAVWAEQKIGRKLFYEGVKKFGFGEKTGIDLPNEVSGSLKNLENKNAEEVDYATASFGQGVSVTPLQMINAFSAIANGGLLMRPYINAELEPYIIRRVIEEKTAKQVIEMMRVAVESGKVATIPQFNIAGKTGTAQLPNLEKGGYYEDKYIHTFIGMFPASEPQYVVLIKIVKPKSSLAALTVVPAFRKLAEFIINYANIPPDKPFSSNK